MTTESAVAPRTGLSRRELLGVAAAGTAGLVVGGIAGPFATSLNRAAIGMADRVAAPTTPDPFFGRHQSGIITPVQDHLQLAAFDMLEGTDRRDLVSLLKDWSAAGARMTQGLPVTPTGALGGDPESPPEDTGEVLDVPAKRLTVTIGFGPDLFERDGVDRFELGAARPPDLEPLPSFAGDALKPDSSHGDLCVQVCAEDPQVCFHTVRNLTRIAAGRAGIRWSHCGFLRTPEDPSSTPTPRNLMGFKDGTANVLANDQAALDRHVWLGQGDTPAWLTGGTYLVTRKVEMMVEAWDREPLWSQEAIFGRTKGSGAPLSGGEEFTPPNFDAKWNGSDVIDQAAHVRLAHPSNNGGIRILRRGYNYVDGIHADGCLDAGLVFISYQRSPGQFIALQRALATDKLNEYIRHVGSAIFAVPPGASEGGFVGETLFG